MSRDPVAELDHACELLRLADDITRQATGQPLGSAGPRADLQAIAGWMRRHPHLTADIAKCLPDQGEPR
jgi:hypothetical protein